MFRKIYRPTLFAGLALTVIASSALAVEITDQALDADQASVPAGARALITHDYVQNELDWRSYYLNRQPGRFRGFSHDGTVQPGTDWLQRPAADGS